jgi:hypothetical protein
MRKGRNRESAMTPLLETCATVEVLGKVKDLLTGDGAMKVIQLQNRELLPELKLSAAYGLLIWNVSAQHLILAIKTRSEFTSMEAGSVIQYKMDDGDVINP